MIYNRAVLSSLTVEIGRFLSEKRYAHTVGAAKCAYYLASLCRIPNTDIAVAAALLHDIAKEIDIDSQLKMIREDGIFLTDEDIETVSALHSFSAQCVIKREFPKFYIPEIISAVSKHTLGGHEMSLIDEVVFLSDFIEPTRKYESSILLRDKTFKTIHPHMYEDNIIALHKRCVDLIDMTIESLKNRGMKINSRIYLAKEGLLRKY